MNVSSLTSKYCENIEEELDKVAVLEHDQDMEEILNHFNQLNQKLKERTFIEKAEAIFKCIPMKMESFYEKFTLDWYNKPILNYYNTNKMIQRITCASNEDIVKIKEMLIDRAKKNKRALEPELEFIKELQESL